MMVFIFSFIFIKMAFSVVLKDDVLTIGKKYFPLEFVCKEMGSQERALIEVISNSTIDCMAKKVKISEFCEKHFNEDPHYLRAYFDIKKSEAICHFGKKVDFKFLCKLPGEMKYCSGDSKNTCLYFREKLAKRLSLVHSSVTMNDDRLKELNCYFESNITIQEIGQNSR